MSDRPRTTAERWARFQHFLIRDIFGTLGWRPDLLTRLEARRPIEVDLAQQPPS